MSSTSEPVTPARLHQLANTAQVAGWGPGGVMPDWLSEVSAALFQAAWDLEAMAARARLGDGDTLNGGHPAELVGANRGWR